MKNMNIVLTQPVEQKRDLVEVQGETFSIIDMLRSIKDNAREIVEYAVGPASIEEIEQRWMSADSNAMRTAKR